MRASSLIWTRNFMGNIFEDWSNRLNHCWTFYLLWVLVATALWWKHASVRIICLGHNVLPANYAHEKCWEATNIDSVPLDRFRIGTSIEIDQSLPLYIVYPGLSLTNSNITYYQYVPLMLAFQALLFKLPHVIWLLLHGYSGINITKIYGLASAVPQSTCADHRMKSDMVARYINTWLKSNICSCIQWRVLTIVAGIVKLLYVINAITQLAVIDSFLLPGNRSNFGSHVIDGLTQTNGSYWLQSPRFPHSVMCQFKVRSRANVHTYTLQCILPINQLHDHLYIFLWLWLLFVVNVSLLNLIFWIVKIVIPSFKTRYVMQFLNMSNEIEQHGMHTNDVRAFVNYLGEDGVVVLKAISEISSELMVHDVVVGLWRMWNATRQASFPMDRPLQNPATNHQVYDPPSDSHDTDHRPYSGSQNMDPEGYTMSENEVCRDDIPMVPLKDSVSVKL